MRSAAWLIVAALLPVTLAGQSVPDLRGLLDRLERVEKENHELAEEIRRLRAELEQARAAEQPAEKTAAEPELADRVAVNENRIEEQAQTKVEASQRFPIKLTGMFLFNTYMNSSYAEGGSNYPTTVDSGYGDRNAGAYLRQSIIGLEFHGPHTIAGGKVSGSLYMDFYGGSGAPLNQYLRIRTGTVQIDWNRTSVTVGQEKPIFSPRNPDSLAQVGVSPLTGAGNPWLWQPQIKVEQRFRFGEQTGLSAQVGIFQTAETAAYVPAAYAETLEEKRPALEGRFEFKHRGLAVAPGFHFSTSHVAATSVPSQIGSVDWLFRPMKQLEFSGLFFGGQNTANTGTLRQAFTIVAPGRAIPVHSLGGWGQLAWLPTERLSFHFMHGQQDDRNSDLLTGGVGKNQAYAANVWYRLAPNVIVALEASQVRTSFIGSAARKNNHYDLALAYLF